MIAPLLLSISVPAAHHDPTVAPHSAVASATTGGISLTVATATTSVREAVCVGVSAGVNTFLADDPTLMQVVRALPSVLAQTMKGRSYKLRVAHDPELAGMTSLVVVVGTPLSVDDAADGLDAARHALEHRLGVDALDDVVFRLEFV